MRPRRTLGAAVFGVELFVERGSRRILGGMGINVYPTVDAGIYAMTNQIVAADGGMRLPIRQRRRHHGMDDLSQDRLKCEMLN
jgi:hypothetical protein